jgi:short-subunit dehydrogenase
MALDLRGKHVFLTGASEGIGRATAAAFVEAGATVLALARSKERLDALVAELGATKVVPFVADVADGPRMERVTREILDRFGAPAVVVANAGIGLDARVAQTSDEALHRVFDVNVYGAVRSFRPFLPAMIERGQGRVVLVSSIVGKRGTPNYGAYSASKFALHGFADALRPELLGTGVTVGIVCPSSTTTRFDERKMRSGIPQNKVRVQRHSPESVARAIVRMARSSRREMVLSPEGRLMVVLNAISPRLMDWVLAKTLVKRDATPKPPA